MGVVPGAGLNATKRQTFYEHLRDGLSAVPAVAPAATTAGTADDALRSALPGASSSSVVEMVEAARLDPRYDDWRAGIAADEHVLDQVLDRLQALVEEAAVDLDTPYAEFDSESGHMVASAKARGEDLLVLMAVLSDHKPGGQEFLDTLRTPEADRATTDRILGAVSGRYGATLGGPALAIHRYLAARRTNSWGIDETAAALMASLRRLGSRRTGSDAETWAELAFEVILTAIEAPGGYLRAELKAAAVVRYLQKAVHVDGETARLHRDNDVQKDVSLDQDLPAKGAADVRTLGELLADGQFQAGMVSHLELIDLLGAVRFTPRELEILALSLEGKEQREIGEALGIRTSTAGVHVKNIYDKLRRARGS